MSKYISLNVEVCREMTTVVELTDRVVIVRPITGTDLQGIIQLKASIFIPWDKIELNILVHGIGRIIGVLENFLLHD